MSSVLLLNAGYEPLAIVTQRRALSLLLRGHVEAACTEALEMHGVTTTLHIPTVIRLRYYVNVPRRNAHWSRKAVLQRDAYTCAYCGIRLGDLKSGTPLTKQDFTVDHILPISRGGKNTWGNTVCSCASCNRHKANRLPHEAHMTLHWEPKIPRTNYLVFSGEVPAAWRAYLKID